MDLLLRWLEHTDARGIDVLDRLVDDRVGLDLHVLTLGEIAGLGLRTHAEADDDRVRRGGEDDVGLGDGAHRRVDDVDAHLGLVHLGKRIRKRLDRSLHVCLDYKVELLELVLAHLVEEGLEGHVLDLVLLLDAGLQGALVGKLLGVAIILEHTELVARGGDGVEAQISTASDGPAS